MIVTQIKLDSGAKLELLKEMLTQDMNQFLVFKEKNKKHPDFKHQISNELFQKHINEL
jgi:hypothetical protein